MLEERGRGGGEGVMVVSGPHVEWACTVRCVGLYSCTTGTSKGIFAPTLECVTGFMVHQLSTWH